MKTHLINRGPVTRMQLWSHLLCVTLMSLTATLSTVGAAEPEDATDVSVDIDITKDATAAQDEAGVTITSMDEIPNEPFAIGHPVGEPREVAWLGIATEEAPEVLTSQMTLDPGVGLVITFVAEESPAARAGLERNDLLVALEDQSLVLPAQLRKLIQSREEGDTVRLTFFRNGKKQQVEVGLGKTQLGPWGDAGQWREQWRGLEKQWRDVNLGQALREPLAQVEQSLGDLKLNQREIQEQIRHAVEQARQAANNPEVREQIKRAMEEARHAMEEARGAMSGLTVPPPPGAPVPLGLRTPKVTVRSSGNSAQSIVQADETGTYVVVRNPKLRLTAHDGAGALLFDGEIETEEQRASVPPEVWVKVEPLVNKLSSNGLQAGPKPLPKIQLPPTPTPRDGTI